ncbi:6-phosphogluconate dehydrogenase C-terminal domain-like protein [Thozetella sp. PMI_491]|nr:6-phosphogluconate dehydrogenase C-terminal domain-like protein [Thozetella sp. PMI_491]
MRSIPKVISGLDDLAPGSLSSIQRLYSKVFDTVVPVATPETAEMVKLYENCQRMMVIAYANEMADACYAHGIDPFEVCRAAATKPFGYLPTDPGLGVGGHCIPVNPYYLLSNNAFPLLQAAAEKMWARPPEIASRVLKRLMGSKSAYQEMKGVKRLLIVGIGFKKGQSHLVNSPSLALATQLAAHPTLEVMFADSLVRQKDVPHIKKLRERNWNRETFEIFDMIIVSHKPEGMDWELLVSLKGVQLELWCQGPEL